MTCNNCKIYTVIYAENYKLKSMSYSTKQEAYIFAEKLLSDPENFIDKDRLIIVNGTQHLFDITENYSVKISDVDLSKYDSQAFKM